MKIRTQLIAGIVVFALLLAIISALVITTNQQVEQIVDQEEIANSIALEVGELGYLSNDYILYREPQQAERWNAKFVSISDHIASLSVDQPDQQALVGSLTANLKNTRSVFDNIVSSPGQPGETDTGFVQLSWSRMAVQNQGMVFDAGRLSHLLREEAEMLKQTSNLLIFALMMTFAAFLLTSYLLFYQRTLVSIAGLQEGARIIGSGNLDYTIDETADDEIGELSRSFNRMTSDLKGVTASKADLEREIASRKIAEENLVRANERLSRSEKDLLVKNEDLNALNEELTVAQEELQQNVDELTRTEAELQRLAEQRQLALDAARMGWWHYDPITRIASWDERYKEIFCVTGYQSPNDEILARLHPEDLPGVWARVEAALDPVNPQIYSAEYRINLPDGSMRWIEAHGIASFERVGENRRATSFVSTVADITERKKAEEALQWLAQFPEKNPNPVLRVAADGTMLYSNAPAQNWLATLGWQAGGPLPNQVRVLATDALGQHHAIEVEIVNPYGTTFWLTAVQPPGEDYVNLYGRDITERKRAEEDMKKKNEALAMAYEEQVTIEEELKQSNDELLKSQRELQETSQYLENLIGYANAPIIVWDPQLRITRFNRAFERLTGRSAESVIGRSLEILFPPDSRTGFMDKIRKTAYGERWETVEIPILHVNGEIRTVLWNSATIYGVDGNTLQSTIAQGQDITERKHAEEQLKETAANLKRSNEDLERFAYVSSHDLQEPLRTIVSFSQLLERRYKGQMGPDADEYIEYIVTAGKRMQALITDLLEFSRVATRGSDLRRTDSETVLEGAIANLHSKILESCARITHNPLPPVTADASQLQQVLQNLISNAIKYRAEGEPPKIHISAQPLDGMVQFSVQDNGIGIEPQYFERIFIIFQRLHGREKYPGTGIGLALVKRIVDRHGGRIWVESEPGKGSTFHFTVLAAK